MTHPDMDKRMDTLSPKQIDWLNEHSPAFRTAYAAVQRRDADVARNRMQFEKPPERAWHPFELVAGMKADV